MYEKHTSKRYYGSKGSGTKSGYSFLIIYILIMEISVENSTRKVGVFVEIPLDIFPNVNQMVYI